MCRRGPHSPGHISSAGHAGLWTLIGRPEEYEAVRAGGAGADVAIEVQVETRIERDAIGAHLNHMDLVIALSLHHSSWDQIFDEKIVGYHEALFVLRQLEIVRTRTGT